MPVILQIVMTGIGSVGFWMFIQFLVQRKDNRNDQQRKILKMMAKAERDNCRTQLLLLMSDYPEEKKEIFTVAEHYFSNLKGDWYMTTLFQKFIHDEGLETPIWFIKSMAKEKVHD